MEPRVPPGVFRQVVAPHEALVAQRAVEALLARVRAVVARQLVRPGELLAAVGPGTLEGALPGVDPQVGFEVGRLFVHLPAAREGAAVPLLGGLLPRRGRPLAAGHFGRLPWGLSAVPGVQPATRPLRLLLRSGAGLEALAAPDADRVRVALVQVQQNHRHHQQSPALLALFQRVLCPTRRSTGDTVCGDRDGCLRHHCG